MNRLIAIVGPTGIGKSRLAVHLATAFNGEIVGADSRQVYRYMDIGTAKPGPKELSTVPHHMVDIINPDEDFSLAVYQEMTYRAIDDIQSKGRLPFLVGGSGLYVRAVLEGWQIPKIAPDAGFRESLEKRAEEDGIDSIYDELVSLDPDAATKIDRRNIRRVIRALEVRSRTKTPGSRTARKVPPPYDVFIIGLTASREFLYDRVDQRVDEMIERGLVQEVEKLMQMGYDLNLRAMSGIGYRQAGQYLKGELSLKAAVKKIKTETHRFIRHQYAWFSLSDKRIHWFDIERVDESVIQEALGGFLGTERMEQELR